MRPRKPSVPPGFRAAPKPKQRPIEELTVRELQDMYDRNKRILSSPASSTSTYVQRISAEQAAVEARLFEINGMETIQTGMRNANIRGEEDMNVDPPHEPPVSRTIEAKRKALSQYGAGCANGSPHLEAMTYQEAIELQQRAHARDLERQQQAEEKRRRMGLPLKGELLTRQEREARIWAFMNHKPTESDLEDDDEDDDDDDGDDPASWFEDDQDDGRKGQDIVEPDIDDLSHIIRIDESRLHYGVFYDPQDDGD